MKIKTLKPLRAGIVGTGYISEFHARAIHATERVDLVSVCDTNLNAAKSFALTWGVPKAYESLEVMLSEQRLDCVHILVPPDLHHAVAKTCLQAGANVFLEKPMSVSVDEANDLVSLAREKKLYIGVNHNMMFMAAYQRLRDAVHSGSLGPIDNININYFSELAQIRFGPFDTWLLRSPGNVVTETGPHLFSILLDLAGPPEEMAAVADREISIPGGARVLRRWRIRATTGRVAAQVNMNFGPGFNERTISVHGLTGTATADLNANTCLIDRRTPLDIDLDRYRRSRSLAVQLRSQAGRTLREYILAKLKLQRGGNPYQISFLESVAAFYEGLRADGKLDKRIDAAFGRDVIDFCVKAISAAGVDPAIESVSRPRARPITNPSILVLGGSGFIGRELIRQLIASGHTVRAMVRGSAAMLNELDGQHLEIVRGDIRRDADLRAAMAGVKYVYHLAVGQAKTWNDYQTNEVSPARLVGELCLALGVKRLIYTGTIDSYYAGAQAGTISEQTPLDPNIARRNYYARAKAAAENILMDLHHTRNLPVVIFRPGIVIGAGGNPFHWGVGRFSEDICEVWGDGLNKLPFVLVADVATALSRGMDTPDIEGRSYNLIGPPLLTARDYLTALQSLTGQKLTVIYRPIWKFYLSDLIKWIAKVLVRHPDRIRIPSYFDWESRTQKAVFDYDRAREDLKWNPASDRERLVEEGIHDSLRPWLAAIK